MLPYGNDGEIPCAAIQMVVKCRHSISPKGLCWVCMQSYSVLSNAARLVRFFRNIYRQTKANIIFAVFSPHANRCKLMGKPVQTDRQIIAN